jgi:phosphonatase-like hydrolase
MKLTRAESLKLMLAGAVATSYSRGATEPAKFRLIVLDVGGTIIQDRGDVVDALQSAFAKHGAKITSEEIAPWRGASKREVVRHFVKEKSLKPELAESIYKNFTAQAIEKYKSVPPIAGAEKAFEQLKNDGLLLAATTGFSREIATSIFQRLQWTKYFTAIVTSDDVAEGRPAPYMIFHAMESARVTNVAEVMIVGDTPLDLQAGANSGVGGLVGVLSGAGTRTALTAQKHTAILDSVADLPTMIAGQPRA